MASWDSNSATHCSQNATKAFDRDRRYQRGYRESLISCKISKAGCDHLSLHFRPRYDHSRSSSRDGRRCTFSCTYFNHASRCLLVRCTLIKTYALACKRRRRRRRSPPIGDSSRQSHNNDQSSGQAFRRIGETMMSRLIGRLLPASRRLFSSSWRRLRVRHSSYCAMTDE